MINKVVSYNTYPSQNFNLSLYRKTLVPESSKVRCFIHTLVDKNNSNNKEEFINDLFKDRIAPVIPFDRKLIKGSCLNYKDKLSKAKFIDPPYDSEAPFFYKKSGVNFYAKI